MKRVIPGVATLALLLAACAPQVLPARLELDRPEITIESPAGEALVSFVSTKPWTAVSYSPWCRVIPDSGNGGFDSPVEIRVLCEENTGHEVRTGQITFSGGGITKTLEIKQNHRSGLIVDQLEFTVSPKAQTLSVPAWSTGPVDVEIDSAASDWISMRSTKAMQDPGISLEIGENTFTTRSGEVRLRAGEDEYTLSIRQGPAPVRLKDPYFLEFCLKNYDFDRDQMFTMDDAVQVESLIFGEVLQSAEGIDQFPELRHLAINQLNDTALDVSSLRHLESLYLGKGSIRELKLGDLPALKGLDLNQTELPGLDLRGLPALERLNLNANPRLSSLSVSGSRSLMEVRITDSAFETLDFSGCPALEMLIFLKLPQLRSLTLADVPNLHNLEIAETTLEVLDLEKCPDLPTLILRDTGIRSLSFAHSGIVQLSLTNNRQLEQLSFTGCEALFSLAASNCEALASLEISDCPSLFGMEFFQCLLTTVTLENLTGMQSMRLSANQCRELTVRNLASCTTLFCDSNILNRLELDNCPALTALYCDNNKLTALDLSGLPELQTLSCTNNALEQLSTARNPRLTELYCSSNKLRELDLSANPVLTRLSCYNNPMLKYLYLKAGIEYPDTIGYDPLVTTVVYR